MTTTTNNTDLYEEAVDFVVSYYQGNLFNDDEDCQELVNDIFGLVVKKLQTKIQYIDKSMKSPTVTMEECGWDCLESQKKAFKEVISMLNGGVKK